MAENDWEEEERNLNDLIDSVATERNIYISTTEMSCREIRELSSTRLHVMFCVIHRCSSDTNPTQEARIICSIKDYCHPFDKFLSAEEAKAEVTSMFYDQRIQFSFDTERGQRLQWKEITYYGLLSEAHEQVPLQGFDDIVMRISEAVASFAGYASTSGRTAFDVAIIIDKQTVVPHQEFDRLIPHHVLLRETWDHENPNLYSYIDWYCYCQLFGPRSDRERSRWLRRDWKDDFVVLNHDQEVLNHLDDDVEEDDNDDGDHDYHDDDDDDELSGAIEESFSLLEMESWSAPAAISAVEALEKFRYRKSCEDEDESEPLTCAICMEEVIIGTDVTRMPCSHVYDSDCILQWLHRNHSCPTCRFKLPTQ